VFRLFFLGTRCASEKKAADVAATPQIAQAVMSKPLSKTAIAEVPDSRRPLAREQQYQEKRRIRSQSQRIEPKLTGMETRF
jgi:hypothetical protein